MRLNKQLTIMIKRANKLESDHFQAVKRAQDKGISKYLRGYPEIPYDMRLRML